MPSVQCEHAYFRICSALLRRKPGRGQAMAGDNRPCMPLNVSNESQISDALECAVPRGSCEVQTLLICRTLQGVERMSLHARPRKASDGMEMTIH